MSMSSIIRAVAGGPKTNTRAEGDQPEEDMEDDIPESDDEDSAEGDQPEENQDESAEDDEPEEDASDEDDGDEPKAAASKSFAAGRKAERQRMAAILGNPAADGNPKLAAHLAFATTMKASDAVSALKAGGSTGGKLAGKMAGSGQVRLGGSAASNSGPTTQPERIAAHANALIEAKRAKRAR